MRLVQLGFEGADVARGCGRGEGGGFVEGDETVVFGDEGLVFIEKIAVFFVGLGFGEG